MTKTYAQEIASLVAAIHNCRASSNVHMSRHPDRLDTIMRNTAPSGSGFDAGTHFDNTKSVHDKLVFSTSFHHMDKVGGYDGWTDHNVTVRPSFIYGLDIKVSGRDRNGIKEYIAETFNSWLSSVSEY